MEGILFLRFIYPFLQITSNWLSIGWVLEFYLMDVLEVLADVPTCGISEHVIWSKQA